MKKKPEIRSHSSIVVPMELKNEFRKTCVNLDLKPCDVAKKILETWIDKNKKKLAPALVVNG